MNKVEKKTYIKATLLLIAAFVLFYIIYSYLPKRIESLSLEIP